LAVWCLFGVYFYKVLERTGETEETMETPRKKKKKKRNWRLSLDLKDLQWMEDLNPSLSASFSVSY
jgi:hypothetical protein